VLTEIHIHSSCTVNLRSRRHATDFYSGELNARIRSTSHFTTENVTSRRGAWRVKHVAKRGPSRCPRHSVPAVNRRVRRKTRSPDAPPPTSCGKGVHNGSPPFKVFDLCQVTNSAARDVFLSVRVCRTFRNVILYVKAKIGATFWVTFTWL
jgi:hypothetical protein